MFTGAGFQSPGDRRSQEQGEWRHWNISSNEGRSRVMRNKAPVC
uniref:Uncharacterized protein n=1 Tax=Anguilla anguilla TaxID=7936 RepID=A0A0E9V0K0_ANGAN